MFARYSSPVYKNQSNHAIEGYDVVSYFVDNKAVKGDSRLSYKFQGAEWHFSSKKNLKAFIASPRKYTPQYGGYCAYAVAKGQKARVNPKAFEVYKGKLYLNYSTGILKRWKEDKDSNIKEANKNWVRIK